MVVNDRVRRRPVLGTVLGTCGLVGAFLLTACSSTSGQEQLTPVPVSNDEAQALARLLDPCATLNLTTVEPGAITFATSAVPAPPFFLTDDPSDRIGLEADLAYALAEQLGFRPGAVTWEFISPDQILSGEFIDYDVAIGGFAPSDGEGLPVAYSQPYLDADVLVIADGAQAAEVAQRLTASSPDGSIDGFRWAFTVQGPAQAWLVAQGQSIEAPRTYVGASEVTRGSEIRTSTDALVVDEYSALWLTEIAGEDLPIVAAVQAPLASYSLALVAGNPMVACVDRALDEMSEVGTLDDLRQRWLDAQAWIEE